MTQLQEMMLSVCFGAVIGVFIGNLIAIIAYAVSNCKEKRRKRKAKAEDADKAQ